MVKDFTFFLKLPQTLERANSDPTLFQRFNASLKTEVDEKRPKECSPMLKNKL